MSFYYNGHMVRGAAKKVFAAYLWQKKRQKKVQMDTKLERGIGGKALVSGPLKNTFVCGFPKRKTIRNHSVGKLV